MKAKIEIQCPLDIPTLDKAAALPIAAATRVTDLSQYINSNLAYSGLKFFVLLLGLEYKSRGFSRKLRPGELLHEHNSVNSQQILMGLQGTFQIGNEKVYHKYN